MSLSGTLQMIDFMLCEFHFHKEESRKRGGGAVRAKSQHWFQGNCRMAGNLPLRTIPARGPQTLVLRQAVFVWRGEEDAAASTGAWWQFQEAWKVSTTGPASSLEEVCNLEG